MKLVKNKLYKNLSGFKFEFYFYLHSMKIYVYI